MRQVLAAGAVLATLGLSLLGGNVSLIVAVIGLAAGAGLAYGLPELRAAVQATRSEADPRTIGGAIIALIAFVVLVVRPATPPAAAIAGVCVGIAALTVFTAPSHKG